MCLHVRLELREVVDRALAVSRGNDVRGVLADVESDFAPRGTPTAAMESVKVKVPSWRIRSESLSSKGRERGIGSMVSQALLCLLIPHPWFARKDVHAPARSRSNQLCTYY